MVVHPYFISLHKVQARQQTYFNALHIRNQDCIKSDIQIIHEVSFEKYDMMRRRNHKWDIV